MLVPIWLMGLFLVVGFVLGVLYRGSEDSGQTIIPPRSPAELEARIRGLLARGQKIQAIKLYREFHHVDLKDAKDIIDDMDRNLSLPSS